MKVTLPEFHFSARERILAGAVILTLFAAFYKLWFSKQIVAIDRLRSEIKVVKTGIATESKLLASLHAKSVQAIRVKGKSGQYSKYLEASRYLSNLIENLGTSDKENSISLLKMNILERKIIDNFHKNSFELEIESSFIALGKFLGAIDSSKLLIEVKSVSLTRIDNEMKRCLATIEVDGYYKPEGS